MRVTDTTGRLATATTDDKGYYRVKLTGMVPPLLVRVTRPDGKKQWAFKGKPLYYWAKDQKPGDKTGDGFNNVWHVAKP